MTPAELTLRGSRAAREAVRRRSRGRRGEALPSLRDLLDPRTVDLDAATAETLVSSIRGRALAVGDPVETERALGAIGGSRDAVVRAADEVLAGAIAAFGHGTLDIGTSPDWLRDPVSGRSWPLVFWPDVDYRFDDSVGDPRYVWEVNRHHHLATLGRAFHLSGEPRFATAVWSHILSWIDRNPPYRGINWSSALEMAIRLISWGMALDLVGCEGAPEGAAERVLTSVSLQAHHLCDNLSVYASSKNNHLIGEAVGLLAAGTLFPELLKAGAWARKGRTLLEREIRAQVSPDGVSREQTLHYQVFVLEFCLVAAALARTSGRPLSPAFLTTVEEMGVFLERTAGLAGSPPSVGDEDGGRVYELADETERQAARAAACAAFAAGRPPRAPLRERDLEPAVWLFGPSDVGAWLSSRTGEPRGSATESAAYTLGGYFVPSSGSQHGVIDCGPLGLGSIAAHGHADCLSLSIADRGRWLVVDPGTYCYHRERVLRDHFRGTAAHNTVCVDGRDQSEILGPFLWGRRARHEQLAWASGDGFDFFDGAHDGYERTSGVRHRRRVVFGKRGYWIVVDSLEGTGRHTIGATFQLAPGLEPTADGGLEFRHADGFGVAFRAWLPAGLRIDVLEGREDPPAGWVSPAFGVKLAAPAVRATGEIDLPATLVFAVVPFEGEPEIDVECLTGAWRDGAVFEATFPEGRDRCFLGRPPASPGTGTFDGAFGFTAHRGAERRAYGFEIRDWKDGDAAVPHEEIRCAL